MYMCNLTLLNIGCSVELLKTMGDAGDVTLLTATSYASGTTIENIYLSSTSLGLQFAGSDPEKYVEVCFSTVNRTVLYVLMFCCCISIIDYKLFNNIG